MLHCDAWSGISSDLFDHTKIPMTSICLRRLDGKYMVFVLRQIVALEDDRELT
jgi:hypothetical protein